MIDLTDQRDAPWNNRRRKWDNVLQKWRCLFWDELTDNERMAELEYCNKRNQQLLKEWTNERKR